MTICKRDRIFAYPKREVSLESWDTPKIVEPGDELECSGHWNTNEGIYCEIVAINFNQLFEDDNRHDVILKFEDFDFWVCRRYEPEEN